jgi:hypothetical protein
MGNICIAQPGGAALLTRAEEEGDLQASYMLAILKYYKHGTTDDVFNHIRHVYGEVTLVRRSEHGGGQTMRTMTRMMHTLWVFATEFQMR